MKKVLFVEPFSTAPLEFGVWSWLLTSSSCGQWMLVYKQTLCWFTNKRRNYKQIVQKRDPAHLRCFAVCTLVVGNEYVSQGHFQFIAIIPCSHPGGQNIRWFVNI